MAAKRQLKKVDVSFISLVGKGANQKTIIYKSASTDKPTVEKPISIAKVDEDQRLVYGIVYSPDEVDSQGDTATAEVIKEMAYNFMKNSQTGNIDQGHDFKADEGYVAESWILKASDPIFPLEKEGSWAVAIKVENAETWEKVKKGEIAGLSMAGLALCEEVEGETETPAQKSSGVIAKIRKWLGLEKSDFLQQNQQNQIMRMTYTLEDVIRQVYEDSTIIDKKAAILTSIDQYKNAVEIQKAGKVFSAGNLEKIKSALATLTELVQAVEPAEDNVQKNNNEDEMEEEKVKAIVKSAVEEAVKPLQEEVATLKSEKQALTERLEKVETATPGSKQVQKEDNAENTGTGSIWV